MALILLSCLQLAAQCSGERWAVKVGLDNDAHLVNLNATNQTTIAELIALQKPANLPDAGRISPTELTTWVLSARLVKYARSYDSDYHMVFQDSSGRTMIGEIPDPGCVSNSSPFRSAIAHARSQFDAMFTASSGFKDANVPVTITGVGFFDYDEGQEGIASNAIELHPIIDIQFGPTFTLSTSPKVLSISQGGSDSVTLTSGALNGFSSEISLVASALPGETTVTFQPDTISAPGTGNSSVTVRVGSTTPVGTYNLVIAGSGGGQTQSTSFTLTVVSAGSSQQLLGNPGFENGSSSPEPWSTTSGVIDNSSVMAPHSGTWKAWLNGFGTTHTDNIYQQVTIPGSATFATLSLFKHIETLESRKRANDTLKLLVRNSGGSTLATLATWSNLDAAAGYQQISFDLLAYRGQTIQVYFVGVENGSAKTSFILDDFSLTVTTTTATPDFTVAASPAVVSCAAAGSATSTISVSPANGFNAGISLAASGLQSGISAAFAPSAIPAPGSGTSSLLLTTASSTPAGTYTIKITGSGGNLTKTIDLKLTVTAGGGTTAQKLGNPGFENGSSNPSPWVASTGVIDNRTAYQAPHSGTWKAWLNGFGTTHVDTLYQQVSIPSTATDATLTFWRHIDTTETTTSTGYDTLKVQIRNASGAVLATLATFSNLNASAGYTVSSFDLMAYRGQTIQIYLIGSEDSSLKTSFVVDDFALMVTTP